MKIDRTKILNKYNQRCGYCAAPIDLQSMQIDHVIPQEHFENYVRNGLNIPKFLMHLSIRDVDHPDNLMPACRSCNNWKHSMSLGMFRQELEAQLDRLRERSSNYRIALRYNLISERPRRIVFLFESYLSNIQ